MGDQLTVSSLGSSSPLINSSPSAASLQWGLPTPGLLRDISDALPYQVTASPLCSPAAPECWILNVRFPKSCSSPSLVTDTRKVILCGLLIQFT